MTSTSISSDGRTQINTDRKNDTLSRLFSSLVSSGLAEVVTFPLDLAKVRLQTTTAYSGTIDCWIQMSRAEGVSSLWSGIKPSLLRQCCYSSLTLVLYEPVRDFVGIFLHRANNNGKNNNNNNNSYSHRLLAGGLSGSISIFVFNWTEVIKTRMQTHSFHCNDNISNPSIHKYYNFNDNSIKHTTTICGKSRQIAFKSYPSSSYLTTLYVSIRKILPPSATGAVSVNVDLAQSLTTATNISTPVTSATTTSKATINMTMIARQVYISRGFKGFWAGVQPNIMRTFLVNASELGTYDECKTRLIQKIGTDHTLMIHISASGIAGVASAIVSTPADVVKTRLMDSHNKYTGVYEAVAKIYKQEGLDTFYKGFLPICCRKIIWCTVFFVSYERVRFSNRKNTN